MDYIQKENKENTMDQVDIEILIARLEERLIAHADSNDHQFNIINENINKMLLQMNIFSANTEADRLQVNLMLQKLDENSTKCEKGVEDLDNYKKKMKPWELFHEWKRIPFYTFMTIFIVIAKDEVRSVFSMILKKLGIV